MIRVDLPFPPSQNALWRMGRNRRTKKRIMYRSKRYTTWLAEADLEWLRQKPRPFKTIEGPFAVSILLVRPDKRSRDCDNLVKAPLDWAQRVGIIENDKNAQKTMQEWVPAQEAPLGMALIITPLVNVDIVS